MTVYRGRPPSRRCCMSSLSPRALTHCGWGLGGVTMQVFPYLNKILICIYMYIHIHIYIYINTYFIVVPRGKIKKGNRKSDGSDGPKLQAWRPFQAQPHGPAPEASASSKHFKMRSTTGRTSRAHFGSWAMSWTGIMARSTSTMKICMTYHDSHSASVARSPSILSMHVRALSSSTDRSRSSRGCNRTPAPVKVSPPTPSGPFPTGREESHIPLASGQGQ
jgi:hypothetical protein